MIELTTMLGFRKDHLSSFYPQVNGQVEAVNKTLKTILKHTINGSWSNCNILLYPALWAYQTNVNTTTIFSPFQLVHGVEAVVSVEWEIPPLKIVIHVLLDTTDLEEHLLHLEHLDEKRRDALTAKKYHKNRVKNQYDKAVKRRFFSEGELVLL